MSKAAKNQHSQLSPKQKTNQSSTIVAYFNNKPVHQQYQMIQSISEAPEREESSALHLDEDQFHSQRLLLKNQNLNIQKNGKENSSSQTKVKSNIEQIQSLIKATQERIASSERTSERISSQSEQQVQNISSEIKDNSTKRGINSQQSNPQNSFKGQQNVEYNSRESTQLFKQQFIQQSKDQKGNEENKELNQKNINIYSEKGNQSNKNQAIQDKNKATSQQPIWQDAFQQSLMELNKIRPQDQKREGGQFQKNIERQLGQGRKDSLEYESNQEKGKSNPSTNRATHKSQSAQSLSSCLTTHKTNKSYAESQNILLSQRVNFPSLSMQIMNQMKEDKTKVLVAKAFEHSIENNQEKKQQMINECKQIVLQRYDEEMKKQKDQQQYSQIEHNQQMKGQTFSPSSNKIEKQGHKQQQSNADSQKYINAPKFIYLHLENYKIPQQQPKEPNSNLQGDKNRLNGNWKYPNENINTLEQPKHHSVPSNPNKQQDQFFQKQLSSQTASKLKQKENQSLSQQSSNQITQNENLNPLPQQKKGSSYQNLSSLEIIRKMMQQKDFQNLQVPEDNNVTELRPIHQTTRESIPSEPEESPYNINKRGREEEKIHRGQDDQIKQKFQNQKQNQEIVEEGIRNILSIKETNNQISDNQDGRGIIDIQRINRDNLPNDQKRGSENQSICNSETHTGRIPTKLSQQSLLKSLEERMKLTFASDGQKCYIFTRDTSQNERSKNERPTQQEDLSIHDKILPSEFYQDPRKQSEIIMMEDEEAQKSILPLLGNYFNDQQGQEDNLNSDQGKEDYQLTFGNPRVGRQCSPFTNFNEEPNKFEQWKSNEMLMTEQPPQQQVGEYEYPHEMNSYQSQIPNSQLVNNNYLENNVKNDISNSYSSKISQQQNKENNNSKTRKGSASTTSADSHKNSRREKEEYKKVVKKEFSWLDYSSLQRNSLWLQLKKQNTSSLQKEMTEQEKVECTFKPALISASQATLKKKLTASKAFPINQKSLSKVSYVKSRKDDSNEISSISRLNILGLSEKTNKNQVDEHIESYSLNNHNPNLLQYSTIPQNNFNHNNNNNSRSFVSASNQSEILNIQNLQMNQRERSFLQHSTSPSQRCLTGHTSFQSQSQQQRQIKNSNTYSQINQLKKKKITSSSPNLIPFSVLPSSLNLLSPPSQGNQNKLSQIQTKNAMNTLAQRQQAKRI